MSTKTTVDTAYCKHNSSEHITCPKPNSCASSSFPASFWPQCICPLGPMSQIFGFMFKCLTPHIRFHYTFPLTISQFHSQIQYRTQSRVHRDGQFILEFEISHCQQKQRLRGQNIDSEICSGFLERDTHQMDGISTIGDSRRASQRST